MAQISLAAPGTLTDRLFPAPSLVRDGLVVTGGALFTALLAQIAIRLPFTPIPLTGQTFAVLVVGVVLGWRRGMLSQLLYVLVGLAGLPVFAGAVGGISALLAPSGGYLVGFIAAAGFMGMLAERGWDRGARVVLAMVGGEVVIYLFGVGWLAVEAGSVVRALVLGFFPFVLGDALKLGAASLAIPSAWRLVGRRDTMQG
jgi:biotin transport system substrate-specific component